MWKFFFHIKSHYYGYITRFEHGYVPAVATPIRSYFFTIAVFFRSVHLLTTYTVGKPTRDATDDVITQTGAP